PEPLVALLRPPEGHPLQIRSQVRRRIARQCTANDGPQPRPTARGVVLEPCQSFREHDFLAREVSSKRKLREQAAGARQNEAFLERARRVVPMDARDLVIARQLAGGLSLAFQA